MTKPIFICKCPKRIFDNTSKLNEVDEIVSGKIGKEYHVFVVMANTFDFEFECYNATDAKDIDLEELKKHIWGLEPIQE